MNLTELVDTIRTMIDQHDYPGFEVRALNLGLPEKARQTSHRVFGEALKYDNTFVRLASLRWFQGKPGLAKNYSDNMLVLLDHEDEWVRFEAVRTLECANVTSTGALVKISSLLKDKHEMVREEAAKACGKLLAKTTEKNPEIIASLREAAVDPNERVRWKAQKALRKLGAYSVSA